jgi:CRP-like cAMP-binding protein
VPIRNKVLDLGAIKTAEQGIEILRQDTRGPGICAVIEGQVAITRRLPNGATFFYYLGGPGFWFGEVGVLTETDAVVSATARTRVRYLLLPADDQNTDTLDLQLSQHEVAQMIGCSRQTVNMVLSDLQKKGLIEVSFRKITICDLRALLSAAVPPDSDTH